MNTPGVKIRDAKFGDIPVSIYQNGDEYFLEYVDEGVKKVHACGTDTMFWETMSKLCGGKDVPDVFTLVDIADAVEAEITTRIRQSQLEQKVREHINKAPKLMPSYVCYEIVQALEQRLYREEGCVPAEYLPVPEILDIDTWLKHAINNKVIFHADGIQHEDKTVRIKQAIWRNDVLYVALALVEAENEVDVGLMWYEDPVSLVRFDEVKLTHHKHDEFPVDYSYIFDVE